jgi:pyruvate,water dikinase
MTYVRWLGEANCHHAGEVGGKAASLSQLASRHNVPAGFAIPGLAATAQSLPADLPAAISAAYSELSGRSGIADPAVAVGSSALDEDGDAASFAGQHDTYLNVRGHEAVIEAVHRCARSAASREALAYRERHGLSSDDIRMAVLVQLLVPSHVSAIVFSANPVTGQRGEIMINASWGLGESIVGGTVTPDAFVVDKRSFAVTSREVARKIKMTILAERGTAEADVPDHLQTICCLEDEHVREMGELALALESSFGHPVDVECAIAHGRLFLLQCRPITTLR